MKSPFLELTNRSLLLSGGHDRPIPRTSTLEFAILATNGSNQHSPKEISCEPRESIAEVLFPINLPSPEMDKVRESMKHLLEVILGFFEAELKQVDDGVINEDESLLNDYVQANNPSTQSAIRPLPENFKRRRA